MKILLFVLSLTISTFAQTEVKCIYKVIDNKTLDTSKDKDKTDSEKKINELFKKTLKLVDKIEYEFLYNNEKSLFRRINIVQDESLNNPYLKLLEAIVSSGTYYQNRADNTTLHQKDVFGEEFLIEYQILSDWKISNETKYINGYKSFKAINLNPINTENNIVEVWFTPNINTFFGPKGYGGLPGLIVEIKMKLVTLQLKKIIFNKKIKIKEVKNKKKITLEEYIKIAQEAKNNR